MHKRNTCGDAYIVDNKLRCSIVGAVNYHIASIEQMGGILAAKLSAMHRHFHIRVNQINFFPCRHHFWAMQVTRAVQHLPLKIGNIHLIIIDNRQMPYPGSRKIQQDWRP